MAQYDINIRDYWRIIRKRRTVIIFTAVLLALFSFVFGKLNEPIPIYSAASAVKFQRSTTVAGLVAEAFTFAPTDEIATQMVIARSYPIIEEVAKGLKLIDPNLSSEKIRSDSRLVSIVNRLRKQIRVEQQGETNIMTLRATSTDPKLAARMANTLARVYQKQMALERNKETRESRLFIENQLKVVEARLRKAENRVKKFQETHRFFTVRGLASAVTSELQKLERDLGNRRNKLRATSLLLKQLRGIKALKGHSNERLFIDSGSPAARLNGQLLDLQLKRDALLLAYTNDHPEVIETNRQIIDLLDEMENELSAEERIRKLRSGELAKQVESARKRAAEVPDIGVLYGRLQQQVKVNGEVYSLLIGKLQTARIREAGLSSEVSIVRPAFEPNTAINKPSLILNSLIGAIIGIVVGLVFAFLLETMDTSIGAIEDVEDEEEGDEPQELDDGEAAQEQEHEDDGEPEAEYDETDPEEAGWAEDDADDDEEVEYRTPPREGRRKSSKTPFVGFLLGILALAGGWLWQEGYPIPYVKARRTLMEPIRKSAPATKPARWKVTGSALPARDEGARSSNGNARSRSGGPKSPSATRPIGPGSSSP